MSVTIYHNPRCSKSRATLALLEERGLAPTVVEYLTAPPGAEEMKTICTLLGVSPRALLRRKEASEVGLDEAGLSDDQLIDAMVRHPVVIERPIVVANGKAALGRPPEKVLDIL